MSAIEFSINVPVPAQLDGFSAVDIAKALSLLMANGYHDAPELVSVGPEGAEDRIVWLHELNHRRYELYYRPSGWFRLEEYDTTDDEPMPIYYYSARSIVGIFAKWWNCS